MSGNLRGNMIIGTVLASFLGVLGLREVASNVYQPHYPEKPGFTVDVPDAPTPGAVEAPKPIDWGVVLADAATLPALVAKGEQLHKACLACHSFATSGENKPTGPGLYGVVNRPAGAHPGFDYSDAMKAHAKPWTFDELAHFIGAPSTYVRGTKMGFAGYRKRDDQIALIAFLRTQAASPAPLPAPLPPEAAPVAPAEAPVEGATPAETAPAEPAPH